jgi:CarD family transcriptional regulator
MSCSGVALRNDDRFAADNPASTLFRCHQRLHLDFCLVALFNHAYQTACRAPTHPSSAPPVYLAGAIPYKVPLQVRVNELAAAEITTAMVSAAFGATAARAKPRDGDPFRAGDYVVYPTHGVGKIEKIGSEEFAGHKLELISISFDENKMTLRVPVAQARAAGLRKLATPETMAQVMTILAGRPKTSRLMWAKRAQEFQAKINSGDLKSVAEVCRDLQSAANGSAPSYSQRNLFELAIDRLAGEYAGIAGTDKADAIVRLTQKLTDGRAADTAKADRVREEAEANAVQPVVEPAVSPEQAAV